MEQSRRSFLTRIAAVAGSAVSLTTAGRTASAGPSTGPGSGFQKRLRTFLEIEDKLVGPLVKFAGGSLVADVEETLADDDTFFTKRPITPRISPLEFTTTIGMEVAFWQRVGTILSHSQVPFSGAIVRTDPDFNIKQRIEFTQAVFSQSAVDALNEDDTKKDTEFQFKLDVGTLNRRAGSGKISDPPSGLKKGSSRNNFRLTIDKIDVGNGIFAIDQVGVTQPVQRNPAGVPILGPLETSSLEIEISESIVDQFIDWFENLVIAGDTSDERVGTLVGLSTNLQTVLWSVRFFNLGVFAIRPESVGSSESKSPTVRVSMYFERAFVTLGPIVG